jgi:hypothetical protein
VAPRRAGAVADLAAPPAGRSDAPRRRDLPAPRLDLQQTKLRAGETSNGVPARSLADPVLYGSHKKDQNKESQINIHICQPFPLDFRFPNSLWPALCTLSRKFFSISVWENSLN